MNSVRFPFLSIYLICLSFSLSAQEIPKPDRKPGIESGLNYVNANVYMGRAEIRNAAILTPDLRYTFANGIFLAGSADFIPNHKLHRLDNSSLEFGFNYSLTDYLEGSISFTKMFYAANSMQITSSVSSVFNAGLDFNNDLLSPGIGIEYSIGKTGIMNDVFLVPNLSHEFTLNSLFSDQDVLTISPTAELNSGTQHFYSNDFSIRRVYTKKNSRSSRQVTVSTSELDKFSLLDYELSLPVKYSLKPFILSFNPVLALPQNKLPVQITAGQQNKAYLFYFNMGLTLRF